MIKMKFYLSKAAAGLFFICFFQGCIAPKKYHAVQDSLTKCQDVNSVNQSIITILKRDTAQCGIRYRNLDSAKAYIEAVSSSEKKHLSEQLNQKNQEMTQKEQALRARESRVNKLDRIIFSKDSAFAVLKNAISTTLTGYSFTQLTIEYKEDNAYISIEEDMLFKPSSPALDPKSRDVLGKLATILTGLPGEQALVEGNTDSLPPSNSKIADNWEMSVLRASSVTKELIKEGVNPHQLMAEGNSSNNPVAPNNIPEARSKNRRVVIIISDRNDLNKMLDK